MNSLCHSASLSHLTPSKCVLGSQPPMFSWNANPSESPAVDNWFRWSEQVWERTCRCSWSRLPGRTNNLPITTGEKCHSIKHVTECGCPQGTSGEWRKAKKLNAKYIGLYKIHHQINEVTYKLDLQWHSRIVPSFHMSHLKPITAGPLVSNVPHHTTCTPQHRRRTSLPRQIHLQLTSQKW